jgi:hypothetical protein
VVTLAALKLILWMFGAASTKFHYKAQSLILDKIQAVFSKQTCRELPGELKQLSSCMLFINICQNNGIMMRLIILIIYETPLD